MDFKNGVKNIQTAGYNGARTVVDKKWLEKIVKQPFISRKFW